MECISGCSGRSPLLLPCHCIAVTFFAFMDGAGVDEMPVIGDPHNAMHPWVMQEALQQTTCLVEIGQRASEDPAGSRNVGSWTGRMGGPEALPGGPSCDALDASVRPAPVDVSFLLLPGLDGAGSGSASSITVLSSFCSGMNGESGGCRLNVTAMRSFLWPVGGPLLISAAS